MAVVTYTTNVDAGDRAGSSEIGHNLFLVAGTWLSGATGGAAGDTIVTGGSNVVAYGVEMDNAGAAATHPLTAPNVTGAGAAALGSIGFLAIINAADAGSWWAIIQK